MQVQNFNQAKLELLQLAEESNNQTDDTGKLADKLIGLIGKFPNLTTDAESASPLCRITEKLFSLKERLSKDKQSQIAELFWQVHHLHSTKVPKLLENHNPAESLARDFQDAEAILPENQLYPVPLALLKGEKLPCDTYFKPLRILLNDETEVTISLGLLAHYSETAQAMLKNTEMQTPSTLTLMQLNKHQFDTLIAYLETGEPALINKENASTLMFAAAYLQIPELIEECAIYLYLFLDDENAMSLLNTVPKNSRRGKIIDQVETYLSEKIKECLLAKVKTPDLSGRLAFYKKNLIHPISLSLAMSDVTDDALDELSGLPFRELDLSYCPRLTNGSLEKLSKNKDLNALNLTGNEWVDDLTLSHIPSTVSSLNLSGCTGISKNGIANLANTSVEDLTLIGCTQLQDEDFQTLPINLKGLNLSYCTGASSRAAERLGKMKHLKKLDLSQIRFSGDHLHLLPKTLEFLNLAGNGLSDASLAALSSMKYLQELHLESCPVSDNGLPLLPESITLLSLNGCNHITDKGVEKLSKRALLKKVFLRRCRNVSRKGLEFFPTSVEVGWDEPQASNLARGVGR